MKRIILSNKQLFEAIRENNIVIKGETVINNANDLNSGQVRDEVNKNIEMFGQGTTTSYEKIGTGPGKPVQMVINPNNQETLKGAEEAAKNPSASIVFNVKKGVEENVIHISKGELNKFLLR